MAQWSNLAKVVYARTYARKDSGTLEKWPDTVARIIQGNTEGFNVSRRELKELEYLLLNRKAGPAGRGFWYSGAPSQKLLGGAALNNCWYTTAEDWENFVIAQDLLMLGGGVGLSVEHRFVSKLSRVKKDVQVVHEATRDADFIVPDSREGWCELTRRVLEAFFVTGKSFSYSTVCIRGQGEPIKGFGGTASGPRPLIAFVEKLAGILQARQGKAVRPIDAMDVLCSIGEMVVAGNVRRSAIIILGDPWDKDYLKAKRWDLGPIPTQRAMANLSVVCDDVDDLHPLFWMTYQQGEPFGIVNRTNIQKYGRMGELKKDTATGVNPCAEATLEGGAKVAEPCNLQELPLPNLADEEEFEMAARLMHRWGKRVTMAHYHIPGCDEVVKRNRRIGTGITGCLQSPLFTPATLDRVYAAIQEENVKYSKELGIPESIRTTVIKPSGTMSKVFDMQGYEGIHAAYSRYYIQRVRFAATDALVPLLRAAGHHIEPVVRFDGTFDHNTVVVDFYERAPEGTPVADEDWTTWKQLDIVKMAQRHWADQSVSVTVYYRKEEIEQLKTWLAENLQYLKTISFLCHSDHGFKQAPKEAVTREQYEKLSQTVRPLEGDIVGDGAIDGTECEGGACPVR
jgi:ribonucleoside-triphosphate reductase